MNTYAKVLLFVSIAVNLFIAAPLLILTISSTRVADAVYAILSERFGKAEIIFIGDSLTLGGDQWGFRLGRYNLSVWNLGKNGFTTRQMDSSVRDAIAAKPKYVFVMAGTNNENQTIEGAAKAFESYKTTIIDPLISAGISPVIELTLYRENDSAADYIDALNSRLAQYAKERGLDVIDMTKTLCENKSLRKEYSKDGLHLTKAAYVVWGNEVRSFLASKQKL